MGSEPERLFLWSGLVWHAALQAYWVSLVVRITIDLGLPGLQLILLGTVMEGALLVAEVPTGVMADTVSRKWSVVVAFVVVGVAQAASGLVATFPLLVATQMVWGVGYTFRSGAEVAWLTDELGDTGQVEDLLLRRVQLQFGVGVAAIGAGVALGRLVSVAVSVVATGLVLVATGVVLAVVMSETGFPAGGDRGDRRLLSLYRRSWSTLTDGVRAVRHSVALRVLAAVMVLVGLASEAVDRLDIRRLDDLGLSARLDEVVTVGVLAVAQAVVGLALVTVARRWLSGDLIPWAVAGALAVAAVGVAVLGLVALLGVAMVGLVVQHGVRRAVDPLATAWANAHAPSSARATVLSFTEQATSVGEIGGGLALGAVAAATTVPTALSLSVLLLIVAALVATSGAARWGSADRT